MQIHYLHVQLLQDKINIVYGIMMLVLILKNNHYYHISNRFHKIL